MMSLSANMDLKNLRTNILAKAKLDIMNLFFLQINLEAIQNRTTKEYGKTFKQDGILFQTHKTE